MSSDGLTPSADEKLADLLAPVDARYVMMCHGCRTVMWRQKDSSYVKKARGDGLLCNCGERYKLIRDRKPN